MSTPVTPVKTYGGVAIALHWTIAACLLCAIIMGLVAASLEESEATERVLAIHKSLGIAIFVLMLARLAWRLMRPPPPLPSSISRAQRIAAGLTHALLYLTVLAMPVAGYIAVAARGRETRFFGLFEMPQWTPLSRVLSQNATAAHVYGQYLIYALLAAHIGAALYHRFVLKDEVLARMLPRRAPETNGPQAAV